MKRALVLSIIAVALPASVSAEPLTRAKILRNAESFAQVRWTMKANNNKLPCAPALSYESDFDPGAQIGMPYKWGGADDVQIFQSNLAKGFGAGSHSTHSATAIACATGQDCSGFVSKVWELPNKLSTSAMSQVAVQIDFDQLQPGDILNKKGSHVVLWVGRRDDGGPLFYEASGPAGKVRLNTTASWSYLDSYVPMRLKTLAAGGAECAGTAKKPIRIDRFPFDDQRTMFLSCSDELDEYSCKPGTLETGREYIYSFTFDKETEIDVKVEVGEGVDVDLHLLSAPSADACLARANKNLKQKLPAGTYFLVADSWTDAASVEREGAYTLSFRATATETETETEVETPPPQRDGSVKKAHPDAQSQSEPVVQPQEAAKEQEDGGCSCRSAKSETASWIFFALVLFFVGARRRKR
jgi:MYXO-CTERM domain-containing protein